MSILQIWVTWASKITIKNFQLCSVKMRRDSGAEIMESRLLTHIANSVVIPSKTLPISSPVAQLLKANESALSALPQPLSKSYCQIM